MKIYSFFVLLLAIVYDLISMFRHGFDFLGIVVGVCSVVALVLNIIVLVKGIK